MKLLAVFVLFCSLFLFAAENKVLKMGYRTNEKLPFIEKAPSDEGFYKDFYMEVAKRMGYKLEIIRSSKMRINEGLENGSIDFYPYYSFDNDRVKYSVWVNLWFENQHVAITVSSAKDLNTINDIKGLTQLESLGNANYFEGYDISGVKKNEVPELNVERALKLLELGRGDFYVYEKDILLYYLKKGNLTNFKIHKNLLPKKTYYYAGFSTKSPLFESENNPNYDQSKPLSEENMPIIPKKDSPVHKFQEVIKEMKNDGFTDKLYKKYFGEL
ncbi:MAG: transporter substrate-binding domain-containing protein [Candidatus Delongbacteria bacterium]|nr:transporter substrate-binding domain-containing protein [Candidatus Delongbacteria bacterium]MBN2835392.1 transporter substrate-binding domain-containing protein [Candidatus Delongbacteria bacterium]